MAYGLPEPERNLGPIPDISFTYISTGEKTCQAYEMQDDGPDYYCSNVACFAIEWNQSCEHSPWLLCLPHGDQMRGNYETNGPRYLYNCPACGKRLGRVVKMGRP